MIELFFIIVEMKRLRTSLVLLVTEEHIIRPVWFLYVDKIVNQAANDKEENDSLGREGRLEKSRGVQAGSMNTP
jgi:hypothetical protein